MPQSLREHGLDEMLIIFKSKIGFSSVFKLTYIAHTVYLMVNNIQIMNNTRSFLSAAVITTKTNIIAGTYYKLNIT